MRLLYYDAEDVTYDELRLVSRRFPLRYNRASRIVNRADRLCVIAAGVLICKVLGVDESGLKLTPDGKPYICGGPEFSISHSGGRCVLAVGEGRIGVDIERLDESSLIAAEAALTREELCWIAPDPLTRFHLLWTRKESIFKAVGGFEDPKQIPALEGSVPSGLFVKSALLSGYALSVCSTREFGVIDPISIK